ncbi:MAG: hypothetical protein RL328_2138, partial [Acidobacteriota bacterium]
MGETKGHLLAELNRLAERGEIVEIRKEHYQAIGIGRQYATGRMHVHRDGYGFVTPDVPISGLAGDVYIPKESAQHAMHGDRVVVRLGQIDYDGRGAGEILRVLRRAHLKVVGQFQARKRAFVVVPHDTRLQTWIEIPADFAIPKKKSADRVGPQQKVFADAASLDGYIVTAEILDFGELGERPMGRVVEVLGMPDDFGIDVEILIRSHHIPHEFPEDVLEQARAIPGAIPAEEIAKREDFRGFDIVTIDGETARDFDDAVWVEPHPNGHWTLQVHIADVSHYVRPG